MKLLAVFTAASHASVMASCMSSSLAPVCQHGTMVCSSLLTLVKWIGGHPQQIIVRLERLCERSAGMCRHVRTLVLDLDDTLIHSDWTRGRGWRTFKRPGAEDFLRQVCCLVLSAVAFWSHRSALQHIEKHSSVMSALPPYCELAREHEPGLWMQSQATGVGQGIS